MLRSALLTVLMFFTPLASLDMSSIDYGQLAIGDTAFVTATDAATSGTVTVTSIVISGTNAADFGFVTSTKNTPTGPTLAGGNNCAGAFSYSCFIEVSFSPLAPGSRTATLTITSNASTSPQTISLSGVGVGGMTFSGMTFSIGVR